MLGRIFSNCSEEKEEEEEKKLEEIPIKDVSEFMTIENIENLKKEYEDLEIKHEKRLEIFKKRNKKYHDFLNE